MELKFQYPLVPPMFLQLLTAPDGIETPLRRKISDVYGVLLTAPDGIETNFSNRQQGEQGAFNRTGWN